MYLTVENKEYEIRFNGRDSREFGLLVAEYPSIPRLKEDVDDIEVEGRSGSLTLRRNTYRNRIIKMKFKLIDIEFFWSNIDLIEEWFLNIKNNKLMYDRNDKVFVVKRVEIGNIEKEIQLYGEFEVTFICEPFLEDVLPTSITFLENNKTIINKGNFIVNPVINLKGNGNMVLDINGETTQIKNVIDEVTIDSNLMLCYGKNNSNMLKNMFGNFPQLEIGSNIITVNNAVEKTIITFSNIYR